MKDKKTIVIMAWRDYWHPSAGGAERYILKVAEYLRNKQFNIVYLTVKYPGAKDEEIIDGIKYIRMGNPISIYYFIPRYFRRNLKNDTYLLIENYNSVPFRIPRYFKNTLTFIHHLPEDKEVWKSNYKFTNNALLQSFLSLGIKINYILGNPIGKFFLNQLIRNYSTNQKIITVSPSTQKELLEKSFDSENISLLYNGIDIPVSEDISKPKDCINIVSVGRLRPTKKLEEGIELMKYTINELGIDNIKLTIAGQGEAEENLKNLTKKYNLENYISFLGYISDKEKGLLLKNSHLHIQFSRKEGWGITVIEAASQATPTICYDVPGLRDSVKDDTGYLVSDRSHLKEVWERAINDIQSQSPEYISKQKNCLSFAAQFKWEEQLKKLDDYLED